MKLTALAGNSYDDRDVDRRLKKAGWKIDGGKDICPDCADCADCEGEQI